MSRNNTNRGAAAAQNQQPQQQVELQEASIHQDGQIRNIDLNVEEEAKEKKIFISGINSLIGHSLFEQLRNDHITIHTGEKPHKFIGTLIQKDAGTIPLPSDSIKVLDFETKPKTLHKQIQQADYIILDMVSGTNPEEAEFILKILRTPPTDMDKVKPKKQVLFFVSSVMTWANTLPKSDGSAYTEHDFGCKVPSPKHQQLKSLEQLAMSSNKINKKLKVHVLCSGLPYGNGESNDMFYEFFRRAWLSLHPQLAALPIVGSGDNVIPTIHVTDLARSIQFLIQNPTKQNHLIAVDQNPMSTQSSIMKAISAGIGSGKTKNVELGDVIDEDFCEFLTLNVKLEPSRVLAEAPFWHCREGISINSMKMLNEEFNLFRGLFPLKVIICGPPASGKSHYAAKLAEVYGIPHITIKDIVQMGQQLEDDFGKKLRERVEELKDIAAQEYEKTRKKKDPDFDRNSYNPRLPDDIIMELVKIQLNSAACQNKGFIMDGYPRSKANAEQIFLTTTEKQKPESDQEGEQEEDASVDPLDKYEINQKVIPQYAIAIEGDNDFLKQRVKELPSSATEGTHFTIPDMDRRLKIYRELNNLDSENTTKHFFMKAIGSSNVAEIQADMAEADAFALATQVIEQTGKPCCLDLINEKDNKFLADLEKEKLRQKKEAEGQQQESQDVGDGQEDGEDQKDDEEDDDEVTKLVKEEEEKQKKRDAEEAERKKHDELEANSRAQKEERDRVKIEEIRQQERDLLDQRSQPIRQYLMDNVVPHLTEGLIDLCKKVPGDPIDYLSDFLLKRADEIDAKIQKQRDDAARAKAEQKQQA